MCVCVCVCVCVLFCLFLRCDDDNDVCEFLFVVFKSKKDKKISRDSSMLFIVCDVITSVIQLC